MAWISSSLRASASIVRCWRASHRPISSGFLSGAAPFVRFSTVSPDLELLQHIQPHHTIFNPPISNLFSTALSVPAGFPFIVDKSGLEPEDIFLKRLYRGERVFMAVDNAQFGRIPSLQMRGSIRSERQYITFRMEAKPDDLRFNIINIWDRYSRHVEGSEKYLEAKGIKTRTIKILFNYLRNRIIPSQDEFPFEIKDGSEKGTLTLRKKCEDEIIIADVRIVVEGRILDELAEYEVAEDSNSLKQSLVDSCQHDLEESMKIFEDGEVGNVEEVGDIGCLVMTVCVYYGNGYSNRIKMDIFAFPDQIAVPGISLTDNSCKGFETFEKFFKDREIHSGTMNFMINYAKEVAAQEDIILPKVFGLFDDSQIEAAIDEAIERENQR